MPRPLTRADLLHIAMRHDTAMSRAMLRALGVPAPEPSSRREARQRGAWRYRGMRSCMRNAHSPMDW